MARDALAALNDFYAHMGAQRVEFASTVLSGPLGGIVLAADEDDACRFVNDYAPEHLQILSKEPERYLGKIKHAGEILLGEYAPSTVANFVVGPSHVLPTGGWAQTGSARPCMTSSSAHHWLTSRGRGMTFSPPTPRPLPNTAFDAHCNAVSELRKPLLGN